MVSRNLDLSDNRVSLSALTVIAGPNGSGKSTLTERLREQGVDFGHYINPDEIAKELTGSYEVRVRAAQQLADRRRDDCIRGRQDFSFETVMSHPSKLDIMRRAKAAGFHVTLYFIATDDPEINVARVKNRVALGGHDVPEDRIRERYTRTMEAVFRATLIADLSVIFDNSKLDGDITPILRLHHSDRLSLRSKYPLRLSDRGFESDPAYPSWITRHLLEPLHKSAVTFVIE